MIRVHQDAQNDLREIWGGDKVAAGRLAALIQQLRTDPALKSKLLEHDFGADRDEEISVSKWHSVFRLERLPVWRLKAWDLEAQGLKYRLIYIYRWRDKSYTILAIAPRDRIDYDEPSHPLRQRIINRIRAEFRDA